MSIRVACIALFPSAHRPKPRLNDITSVQRLAGPSGSWSGAMPLAAHAQPIG